MPFVFYVLTFYFLVSLLLTYPLMTAVGRAVSDPVDPILNTWILAWNHHALLAQPLELLNANIFYPYTQTLLYSETLLLPSLILLPVSIATGNPIFTHNVFVWMGFATTGASGYLLGRWLFRAQGAGRHWAGLMLGAVLAFNSYTLSNVAQAQLLHLEWLPLALLYLGKLLERPRLRFALLFAFFLIAQFYTVIYYGLFSFVITGVVGGVAWFLKSFPTLRVRLQSLALLVGGAMLALLLCLPLALPYYNLSVERDFARNLAEVWPFSASLEMWMSALPQNLVYGALLGDPLPTLGFYPVDALFPGLFLLLMAASGLVLWFLRASSVRVAAIRNPLFLLLGIVLFFILSLGPYPQTESLGPDFDQRLPYAWVHQWVPGFHALRAPGRFAVIVFLGLGVASAYLLTRLRWRVLQASALLIVFVEALAVPIAPLYTPSVDADRRAAYEWLATQRETVYLELPVERFGEGAAERWLESQFGSLYHWQSTPVGYSGFFPAHHDDLLRFLSRFPADEVVAFLQALGVEWLLLHPDRLPQQEWQAMRAVIQTAGWETQQWGDVWGVHLPVVETELPNQTYFIPDRARRDGLVSVAAIFMSDRPTPLLPDSELGAVRAEWWSGDKRVLVVQKRYQPPFFVDPVAVAPVSIDVPESEGIYHLQLVQPQHEQILAEAEVTVVADVAAPERKVLPVAGVEAKLVCPEGKAEIHVILRTIGWYENAFTLSARVLDEKDVEVARSAADVEFLAEWPRRNLLTSHTYALPLEAVPSPELGSLMVDLIAYQWQQEAERTVPRLFVTEDGYVVDTLQLPLQESSNCK